MESKKNRLLTIVTLTVISLLIFAGLISYFWSGETIEEGPEYLGNIMKAGLFSFMKAGLLTFLFAGLSFYVLKRVKT